MPDFVSELLEHTKEYESPTSFWKWSAYAAIAGVLRDNIWMADGDSRFYPNLYILFLAGSAQRKGRPITTAEHLVYLVNNVKIISGRASIQAILMELGHAETTEEGKIKKGGAAIFFAPELAAGLVSDDESIQILTDIYDYKITGHTTSLIGRGRSRIDQLVFSFFAASNEELIKELYSNKAIYGGLLGRTFLICPDEFRPSNAFPSSNPEGFKKITERLRSISELKGEISFTREAKESYKEWYEAFREKSRGKSDRAGVIGRLPSNIKKLAIVIAANHLEIQVNKEYIEQAIEEGVKLLPNYNNLTMTSGKNTTSDAAASLVQTLYSADNHLMSKKALLQKHWMLGIDHELMDKALITLTAAGMTKETVSGNDMAYQLTDKCLEILSKGK